MCGCRGVARAEMESAPYVVEVGVLNDPAMLRRPQNKNRPHITML